MPMGQEEGMEKGMETGKTLRSQMVLGVFPKGMGSH